MFRKKDKHKKYENKINISDRLKGAMFDRIEFTTPDILKIYFAINKFHIPPVLQDDSFYLTFHNVYSFRYTEGWDVMYNLPVDPPSLYGELVYFTKQSDYIDSFLELASCYGIILDGVELTNYLVTTIDVIDIISYSEPLLEFL